MTEEKYWTNNNVKDYYETKRMKIIQKFDKKIRSLVGKKVIKVNNYNSKSNPKYAIIFEDDIVLLSTDSEFDCNTFQITKRY